MKKKRLGELPELQKQLQAMGVPKEVIQQEADTVVSKFDVSTKKGRIKARKAFYDRLKKDGSGKDVIMVGDPIPPPE